MLLRDSILTPSTPAVGSTSPDLTWLSQRLQDLLLHAPSAIGITAGPEHHWVYVNHARVFMAGRSSVSDFIGKTVRQTYPELEGGVFFENLDSVYRTGVAFIGKELKAGFRRGPANSIDDAYVDCAYQPILTPDGKVEGILIHTVEVTEKVLARQSVERANEREKIQRTAAEFERNQFRELFKQAPAGISILQGPKHQWTFANKAYCDLTGRRWEDLANRTIRETLPELEGQGFFELLDQVFRTGIPYVGKDMKAMLARRPGAEPEECYFDFIYQPVRNIAGEVEGIMALAVDVSEQFKIRTQLEFRVQERTIDLQRAHESLRNLSGCLMRAQDDERRRVARELHDSTGQYLAAIQMNLSALSAGATGFTPILRRRMDDTIALVDQCTAEIRTLSYLLHPPLLDDVGLASAITWYAEGFAERSGIAVHLDLPKKLPRFPSDFETALFRVVQQSLTNVHRHSGGKAASIRLIMQDQSLHLEICDEGGGFPGDMLSRFSETGQLPGAGISGMRERILALNGSFKIESTASGTNITVNAPIPQ